MSAKQPQPQPESAAYAEGYKAGYQKGFGDGIGVGYADAKARAWNAVDASVEGSSRSVAIESLRRSMTSNVGQSG